MSALFDVVWRPLFLAVTLMGLLGLGLSLALARWQGIGVRGLLRDEKPAVRGLRSLASWSIRLAQYGYGLLFLLLLARLLSRAVA